MRLQRNAASARMSFQLREDDLSQRTLLTKSRLRVAGYFRNRGPSRGQAPRFLTQNGLGGLLECEASGSVGFGGHGIECAEEKFALAGEEAIGG